MIGLCAVLIVPPLVIFGGFLLYLAIIAITKRIIEAIKKCRERRVMAVRENQRQVRAVADSNKRYDRILEKCVVAPYDRTLNAYSLRQCRVIGENIRILGCSYLFQKNCIEEWIREKLNSEPGCPICKMDISTRSLRSSTSAGSAGSNGAEIEGIEIRK